MHTDLMRGFLPTSPIQRLPAFPAAAEGQEDDLEIKH